MGAEAQQKSKAAGGGNENENKNAAKVAYGPVASINTCHTGASGSVARVTCVESGQTRLGMGKPHPLHPRLFDDRLILEPRSNYRCFPACECVRCRQLVKSQKNAKKKGTKKMADTGVMRDRRIAEAKEFAVNCTQYVSTEV